MEPERVSFFQQYFQSKIFPLYHEKRNKNNDTYLLIENNEEHDFYITEHVDFTQIPVYVIDPERCQDPDDGFSIYFEEEKCFLAIHIADPTHWIDPYSSLFKDILSKATTHYPSNSSPIHLMPQEIVEKSCLAENKFGMYKNALTLVTEIDQETNLPIGCMNLYFTTIKLSKYLSFDYKKASKFIKQHDSLKIGVQIGEALLKKRCETTIGAQMNNYLKSGIKWGKDGTCILVQETIEEKLFKDMIAEFAILANSFIGNYLHEHLSELGMFRACDQLSILLDKKEEKNEEKNEEKSDKSSTSSQKLLMALMEQGIKASYTVHHDPHKLVGADLYCHMTSPIRRAPDCICHYLLKYIYFNQHVLVPKNIPWNKEHLLSLADHFTEKFRQNKKIQFIDNKLRYIQCICSMLEDKKKELNNEQETIEYIDQVVQPHVSLTFCISNYSGLFVNINVTHIDYHAVYFSYRVKVKNIEFQQEYLESNYKINISYVPYFQNVDNESLPELDHFIRQLFPKKMTQFS